MILDKDKMQKKEDKNKDNKNNKNRHSKENKNKINQIGIKKHNPKNFELKIHKVIILHSKYKIKGKLKREKSKKNKVNLKIHLAKITEQKKNQMSERRSN